MSGDPNLPPAEPILNGSGAPEYAHPGGGKLGLDGIDAIVRDPNLSPPEKVVLLLYRSYENGDGRGAFPGDELLASHLDCSPASVPRYRRALRKKGFLKRKLRGRKPARYWAVIPKNGASDSDHAGVHGRNPDPAVDHAVDHALVQGEYGGVGEEDTHTRTRTRAREAASSSSPGEQEPSSPEQQQAGEEVVARRGEPQRLCEHERTGLGIYLGVDKERRYFVRIGRTREEHNTAPTYLPRGVGPEDVVLEHDLARKLANLPRTLGEHPDDGERVRVGVAVAGPWILHEAPNGKDEYIDLPPGDNPLEIDLERGLEVLEQAARNEEEQKRKSFARGDRTSEEDKEAYRQQVVNRVKSV